MSSTVRSRGFMAVIANADKRLDYSNRDADAETYREEFIDRLYNDQTGLQLSYDGLLVFSDQLMHKSYTERENIYALELGSVDVDDAEEFVDLCAANKLEVIRSSVVPYSCVWYNGSDSPMSIMTAKEFARRTGVVL